VVALYTAGAHLLDRRCFSTPMPPRLLPFFQASAPAHILRYVAGVNTHPEFKLPVMLRPLALLLALLGCGLAPTLPRARACTSLLVSPSASSDGSVLLARSDDGSDAITDTNNLVWHPPREGPAVWRSNMNNLQVNGWV